MADLNTELEKLALAKAAIRESINNKGVEVDSSLPFSEYASKIDEIGGSKPWSMKVGNINVSITDIINYSGYKVFLVEQTNVNNKSWELFLKIKKSTSSGSYVSLINDISHWGSIAIYQYSSGQIGCALGTGSSWVFDDAMQINFPNDNDYFYIKYSFDGNNLYELTVYDKNKVQYSHDSLTNSYKLSTMNLNLLSNWDGNNHPTGASIDLSESYLKVDGEFIQGGN